MGDAAFPPRLPIAPVTAIQPLTILQAWQVSGAQVTRMALEGVTTFVPEKPEDTVNVCQRFPRKDDREWT